MNHKQVNNIQGSPQSAVSAASSPISVWGFLDGRAGHRNQVSGLIDALANLVNVVRHDVDVTSSFKGLRSLIPGRLSSLSTLPTPRLLIGAGHATHLPMLAAKRKYGGRTIVLMKPTLPIMLFDLCLIPEADEIRNPRKNVILTEGALNRIQPSEHLTGNQGLILIGGPSDHFVWSDSDVLRQIRAVIDKTPDIEWTLTTSRRTPPSFLDAWRESRLRGLMVPVEQTNNEWLPSQLQSAGTVWVTNESVSMIYEALTSGASVGILTLAKVGDSRVTRGIDSLVARNIVTPFDRWQQNPTIQCSQRKFNEASRCAILIFQTLLCPPAAQPESAGRKSAA